MPDLGAASILALDAAPVPVSTFSFACTGLNARVLGWVALSLGFRVTLNPKHFVRMSIPNDPQLCPSLIGAAAGPAGPVHNPGRHHVLLAPPPGGRASGFHQPSSIVET